MARETRDDGTVAGLNSKRIDLSARYSYYWSCFTNYSSWK